MKRFRSTRLFTIVIMIVMGIVQTWAQDNASVTIKAPTITPGSQVFDGNISVTINVEEGCTIYYKWGSRFYTSQELQTASVKKVDDSSITLSVKGKNSDRYLSAIAVKDNNGSLSYSDATQAKYTYTTDNKKTLSLISTDFTISVNETKDIIVTAKDGANEISNLTYKYVSDNEKVATVGENGKVKGIMAGNAAITVSFEGNELYKEASTIVNVTISSSDNNIEEGTVFSNIADVKNAGQKTLSTKPFWILQFSNSNPATVVGVFKNNDPDLDNGNDGENYVFIVDNSNQGLMIPYDNKSKNYIQNLKVGDKITGSIIGKYKQITSMIPEFSEISDKQTFNNKSYTTDIKVDVTGEASDSQEAIYPINELTDVRTLASTNGTITDGNVMTSSYGKYLNTIISVPGTIRKQSNGEYYLVQDENSPYDQKNGITNRIFFNSSQINIDLDDYVGTSGTFEGILIKRIKKEPKLVILKNNFFQINKIYLDENDDEKRIDDLVNAGAFDDEVDIYVHRTKLVNPIADAWNTLCFPFDLTKDEFKAAFGCDLTDLAAPQWNGEELDNDRLTKIGTVDSNNNLLFNKVADLNIEEGMPYLMKASGTQTACANTTIKYKNSDGTIKTPQDLIKEDANYYAHIGQKMITVVPPHQIRGCINNKVVGGNFYLRGLYGSKQYTENADGSLTNTPIADSGSQKYQYISTAEHNYLKYLKSGSTLKFPGFRAYFYFPNWSAEENNKAQSNPANNTTNAKVFLFVENSTTGINDIHTDESHNDGRIYNLAGQVVDSSYKGIVIKNGRKYLAK